MRVRVLGAVFGALLALVASFVVFNWAPDRPAEALAARWAPPPSQFVDVAGMRVHVRDEGPRDDPRPIVLLHGTSCLAAHLGRLGAGAAEPNAA